MNQGLAAAVIELRDNPRLRVGLAVVLAIAWLYGLLVWDDAQSAARTELQDMRERIDRLRPFERAEGVWQDRAAEARALNAGLQSFFWEARTRSLAEAAFRDWVQARAQDSGMKVRELTVRAVEGPQASTTGTGATASAVADRAPDRLVLRARLVAGFVPSQTAQFLVQLHESPRYIGVQRLQIRNPSSGQDGAVEFEVQGVFVIREAKS